MKEKNKKGIKKEKYVLIAIIAVLLLAVIGISYAYYVTFLRGKKTSEITLASARVTYTEQTENSTDGTYEFNVSATSTGSVSVWYGVYIDADPTNSLAISDMLFSLEEKVDPTTYKHVRGFGRDEKNYCYNYTDGTYTYDQNCYQLITRTDTPGVFEEIPYDYILVTKSLVPAVAYGEKLVGDVDDSTMFSIRNADGNLTVSDPENYCRQVTSYMYESGAGGMSQTTYYEAGSEQCEGLTSGLLTIPGETIPILYSDFPYREEVNITSTPAFLEKETATMKLLYFNGINTTDGNPLNYSKDYRIRAFHSGEANVSEVVQDNVHTADFSAQSFKYKVHIYAFQTNSNS